MCPKGHRLFVLLLWHTRGFSLVFSGKTVWFDGGWGWGVWGCGGWDGALYPHLPAGMGVGELWGFASFGGFLPTMAWCLLPLRVGPRFASLSFSAPGGKYGPCSALARRSQVPSRRHPDGGKSGRSPIQTFPGHLPQTGGNTRQDSVVVFGGRDFLPPLCRGWVWFPFCLLAFLAFRPGWGSGVPPLPLSLAVGV